MSPETPIQNHLRARFREAFGPPHHTMGHDDHWKLRSTNAHAINVLVNGSPEKPAVWMFDGHTHDDGVFSRTISHHDHVDEVIALIQARVKHVEG